VRAALEQAQLRDAAAARAMEVELKLEAERRAGAPRAFDCSRRMRLQPKSHRRVRGLVYPQARGSGQQRERSEAGRSTRRRFPARR
jgi:hypothetical protein